VTALVDRLAALAVDQAVILTSFHQSALPLALLLRMAGVGTIAAISDDYPGSLLDVRHHVPADVHEVERNLSVVATLGYRPAPGDDGRLAVVRTGRVDGSVALPADRYAVVHPGASVPARAWSPQLHRELVAVLAESLSVVVTGGRDDTALAAFVASGAPDAVDVAGRLTFGDLAEVLAGAAFVVVANTGPAHLAAAVGTPVVSLFAPTVPAVRWRPWGVPHVLLGAQDIGCAGCRARVCPVPAHPCIDRLTVDEVVRAVGDLGWGSPAVRREPAAEEALV
jgi:ADP-heptose:LPS heptosyltransferase